jgi:hypothetical protein
MRLRARELAACPPRHLEPRPSLSFLALFYLPRGCYIPRCGLQAREDLSDLNSTGWQGLLICLCNHQHSTSSCQRESRRLCHRRPTFSSPRRSLLVFGGDVDWLRRRGTPADIYPLNPAEEEKGRRKEPRGKGCQDFRGTKGEAEFYHREGW